MFGLDKRTNRLYSQFYGRFGRCKYRKRWLKADNYSYYIGSDSIRSNTGFAYPAGWHTYHSFDAAKRRMDFPADEVVARVLVKEPLATGYQGVLKNRVTVSRYIKIEEVYV